MIRRLARSRAFQFGAVLAVVIAGKLLPEASSGERERLPAPDTFWVADAGGPGESTDPRAVAIDVLRTHTRFPQMAPETVAAKMRSLATPADAPRLTAAVLDQLERLRSGYPGGDTRFWVGPLGTRREEVRPGREQVDVWFSRVVAAPGRPVYAEWRIARVTLAEEKTRWRLAAYEDIPGPRPEGRPTTPEPTADPGVLSGFEVVGG